MSETLQTRIQVSVTGNLSNALPLETITANPSDSVSLTLTNGVGANAADQIWSDQRTLAPAGVDNINVINFSGSADGVGGALSIARVKCIYVRNLGTNAASASGFEADALLVGGAAVGAWTTPFNGNSTAVVKIPSGGLFESITPGAVGASAGGSSGSIFKVLNNSGTATLTYNIFVVGATA